jgi:hypothetical protein
MVTRADKGNSLVIIYQTDYNDKVQSFLHNNSFSVLPRDPTTKFQNNIRKTISASKTAVPQDTKWKLINLNPSPSNIHGLIKIHNPDSPIRPIINWRNAPAYKLAQHISRIFTAYNILPYAFNTNNTVHLMEDLLQVNINQHTRFASFDITNMYTNIPTQQIPKILTLLYKQNVIDKQLSRDLIALTETIAQQNYFRFQDTIYTQTEGLAMGAPTSSILSEIFIQYLEHTALYEILLRHHIIGYYRYVDDLLLVFDARTTNIHDVLLEFNAVTPTLRFTLEEEKNNKLTFLDITIIRNTDNIQFNVYRKPTVTDAIIPADSCHPNEHKQSAIKFLTHRNKTYPTTPENKQEEEAVIRHILQANQYRTSIANRNVNNYRSDHRPEKPTKWAKFTYVGREVRAITNLFKHTTMGVAFNTIHNIERML